MTFLVKDNRFQCSRLVKPTKENTLVYTDWNIKKKSELPKKRIRDSKISTVDISGSSNNHLKVKYPPVEIKWFLLECQGLQFTKGRRFWLDLGKVCSFGTLCQFILTIVLFSTGCLLRPAIIFWVFALWQHCTRYFTYITKYLVWYMPFQHILIIINKILMLYIYLFIEFIVNPINNLILSDTPLKSNNQTLKRAISSCLNEMRVC